MPKPKFYVVWNGRKTGIYHSWKECEEQVKGFVGAVYKSFPTLQEAQQALDRHPSEYIHKGYKKAQLKSPDISGTNIPVWESLSVDAACSGNPGVMEYRGVWTKSGEEVFHGGPFSLGTVNLGEFLGIVHGLAFLIKQGNPCPVYSDSRTAIKWVRDKAIKTKLERSEQSEELFGLIDRALAWLHENDYSNPVLKWDTAAWGEILADFGRK